MGKGLGWAPGTTPKAKHRQKGWEQAIQQDYVAEAILERLRDLENHPQESLTPYEEFEESGEFYYFTPEDSSTVRMREPKGWGTSSAGAYRTRCGTTGPTTGSRKSIP